MEIDHRVRGGECILPHQREGVVVPIPVALALGRGDEPGIVEAADIPDLAEPNETAGILRQPVAEIGSTPPAEEAGFDHVPWIGPIGPGSPSNVFRICSNVGRDVRADGIEADHEQAVGAHRRRHAEVRLHEIRSRAALPEDAGGVPANPRRGPRVHPALDLDPMPPGRQDLPHEDMRGGPPLSPPWINVTSAGEAG